MSLITQVRDYVNLDTSQVSDSQIVTYLNAGATFLVNTIPKTLLGFLAEDITTTDGLGIDITSDRIYGARRGVYTAQEIPEAMAYTQESALNSMFIGTDIFPKYYIRNGRAFIKPDPTVADPGYVTMVQIPEISAVSFEWVGDLGDIENPAILYASALAAAAASDYWNEVGLNISQDLSTSGDLSGEPAGYRDALDKAEDLVDSGGDLTQGDDMESYLQQEDTEMIAAGINIAQQEISRALAELRKYEVEVSNTANLGNSISSAAQLYLSRSQQLFEMAKQEVGMYVSSNERMIALGLQSGGEDG